jgi:hypothetical protein
MESSPSGASGNVCGVRVQSAIPASIRRGIQASEIMAEGTGCMDGNPSTTANSRIRFDANAIIYG